MNWKEAIAQLDENFGAAVKAARENVRSIVEQANAAVGSAEASILIPTEDRTELCFFLSLNPKLDAGEFRVSREESISGFVFDSGQVVAKVRPANTGVEAAYEAAGVETEFLLAAPVIADESVLAVATFVNRPEGVPGTGFNVEELALARESTELYAIALQYHQRLVQAYRLAYRELNAYSEEIGAGSLAPGDQAFLSLPGSGESLDVIAGRLSGEKRRLLERFGRFLLSDYDWE